MRVLVLSLLAIITGFWMSAAAEEAEIKAPAPDWVVEQPISNMPDDRANSIRDGIGFLLTDTQKKWDGDGYDYYDRMVYEITERTGLEAAARITPLSIRKTRPLHSAALISFEMVNGLTGWQTPRLN